QWCSSLEESCKIYYLTRSVQAAQVAVSKDGLEDL
ncbi:unnamed protein product, partial [marine sediment metagenome]